MLNKMQLLAKLMQDEDFRKFMSNPKVRSIFMDPEFQEIVRKQDLNRLTTHPKFASMMQDPEIAKLMLSLKANFFEK